MSVQGDVLRRAIEKIEGDRNRDYGAPHTDFERTAGMLNSLGYRGPGGRLITGADWAIILICGKLSRLTESPDHEDSVQDIAGYAGCYWEAEQWAREQLAHPPVSDDFAHAVMAATQMCATPGMQSLLCPGGACGENCQRSGLAQWSRH